MKVKELMKLLRQCDENATVFVETNLVPDAKMVSRYYDKEKGEEIVYIADDMSYVESVFRDSIKKIVEEHDDGLYEWADLRLLSTSAGAGKEEWKKAERRAFKTLNRIMKNETGHFARKEETLVDFVFTNDREFRFDASGNLKNVRDRIYYEVD